jgi:hypothetical protein
LINLKIRRQVRDKNNLLRSVRKILQMTRGTWNWPREEMMCSATQEVSNLATRLMQWKKLEDLWLKRKDKPILTTLLSCVEKELTLVTTFFKS